MIRMCAPSDHRANKERVLATKLAEIEFMRAQTGMYRSCFSTM